MPAQTKVTKALLPYLSAQHLRSASGFMGRQIKSHPFFCRSELAREEPEGAAFIQEARVIVNDHREQARSYIFTTQVGYQAAVLLLLILGAPLNHDG